MDLIEDIIDALLLPFKILFSVIGDLIGSIITLLLGIIGALLLPIRVAMFIDNFQGRLNEISMALNAAQWVSQEISRASDALSLISNMTSGVMNMTALGVSFGNIFAWALELLAMWFIIRFLPEISHY
jgi:hypothetical protein